MFLQLFPVCSLYWLFEFLNSFAVLLPIFSVVWVLSPYHCFAGEMGPGYIVDLANCLFSVFYYYTFICLSICCVFYELGNRSNDCGLFSFEVCGPVSFGLPLLMTYFSFSLIHWLTEGLTSSALNWCCYKDLHKFSLIDFTSTDDHEKACCFSQELESCIFPL